MRFTEKRVDFVLDENIPYKVQNRFDLHGDWYVNFFDMDQRCISQKIVWNGFNFIRTRETLGNGRFAKARSYGATDNFVLNHIPSWYIQKFPKELVLDGYFSNYNVKSPDWENVKFIIIDIPIYRQPFSKRLERIKEIASENPYLQVSDYKLYKNIEEHDLKRECYLIKADSHYTRVESRDYIKLFFNYVGWAALIGFVEGEGSFYGHLGKYKCKLPRGKFFYCKKGIPKDIKENYIFQQTRLIDIERPWAVGKIGDRLVYNCNKILIIENVTIPVKPNYMYIVKCLETR